MRRKHTSFVKWLQFFAIKWYVSPWNFPERFSINDRNSEWDISVVPKSTERLKMKPGQLLGSTSNTPLDEYSWAPNPYSKPCTVHWMKDLSHQQKRQALISGREPCQIGIVVLIIPTKTGLHNIYIRDLNTKGRRGMIQEPNSAEKNKYSTSCILWLRLQWKVDTNFIPQNHSMTALNSCLIFQIYTYFASPL